MPGSEECLFSLELVVEKLYIPHVTCRFPSVAFRLLDFPTIIISHVEDDLGKAIRRKISFDSDYKLPDQFAELKDKHGNFMVRKGKSCLFKMVAETLKNHLSSTPLYVMVIDLFPETPKLVGNSTVPLNVLMDAVCADLIRLGPSVPSAHGDKGLFKIYNLMGTEVGYFVLGFRLLCLGPSLIPHLPEAALVPRLTKKGTREQNLKNEQIIGMIQLSQNDAKEEDSADDCVEMKTTGSMTDVLKQDAMMQTVEMANRPVNVDIQEVTALPLPVNTPPQAAKDVNHCATQTEKKKIKTLLNAKQKILEDLAAFEEQDDKDEVLIANIVCPPPLFYNSEAMPPVEVNYDSCSSDTELSMADKLTVESLTDEEAEIDVKPTNKELNQKQNNYPNMGEIMPPPPPVSYQSTAFTVKSNKEQHKKKPGQVPDYEQTQKTALQSNAVFPLLSALMKEIMCIQNPSLFQNMPFQMPPHIFTSSPHVMPEVLPMPKSQGMQEALKIDGAYVTARKTQEMDAAINIVPLEEKIPVEKEKDVFRKQGRIGHSGCAHPYPGVPKEKSWLRSVPEHSKRKSKLTFGLTNTQRLRLQKTNPSWLIAMERNEAVRKPGQLVSAARHNSRDDLNTTSLSDTLTEVRRQAQKELEKTGLDDTFKSESNLHTMPLSTPQKELKSRHKSSTKKQTLSRGKATNGSSKGHKKDLVEKNKLTHEMESEKNIQLADSRKNHTGDTDELLLTTGSNVQSSGRSIEVRIPIVDAAHDDVSEPSFTDSGDESPIPLPDESYKGNGKIFGRSGFPGYLRHDRSLPDAIEGQPNCSLNTTGIDENSPLESTRNSKQYSSEFKNSKTLQSTDDCDTKMFHSGSEPELQGLVSDDEEQDDQEEVERHRLENITHRFPVINPMLSQQSPVPSMRHSVVKLDLNKSQIPPTPRKDDINLLSSRSESPKRPTPRPRKPTKDFRESAHTDSISSYIPSDPDNLVVSISSGEGNYSDDFQDMAALSKLSTEKPRIIPSTQLGYTIY